MSLAPMNYLNDSVAFIAEWMDGKCDAGVSWSVIVDFIRLDKPWLVCIPFRRILMIHDLCNF